MGILDMSDKLYNIAEMFWRWFLDATEKSYKVILHLIAKLLHKP
jgi:hypothetical protein